jgi:cyclopropane fatty-acyl-phospholipid synthase-like methyltransferase
MTQPREFPNWEQLYQDQAVESMPWFNPGLDPDLAQALVRLNLQAGTALDLGTGPGTQAIALAERGLHVTATDLSETAIAKARKTAQARGLVIDFRQDDVLNSQLEGEFDLILDRGCFHVLPPNRRQDYVEQVHRWLQPRGYLFLKCFSHQQPGEQGPYRFTPEAIRATFGHRFIVESILETVYHGTLDPMPQALFCTLEKA